MTGLPAALPARFAVLADIHGNADALRAVLADIGALGIALTVNLGDVFSGPLPCAEVWDILAARPMPTVRGNHDRALIDRPRDEMGDWDQPAFDRLPAAALDWVRSLPVTLTTEEVLACHATPARDNLYWTEEVEPNSGRMVLSDEAFILAQAGPPAQPLLLYGHSHIPRVLRLADGRLLVNPGSVGCPAYLDDRPPLPHRAEAGSPDARYAILDRTPSGWAVGLRAVPYDPARMVAAAEAAGEATWASALRSGRV